VSWRKLNELLLIFPLFLVATMKNTHESQIVWFFVSSILSWIGTDGQCLAAPHTHISTLELDQLTHLGLTNLRARPEWTLISVRNTHSTPKPPWLWLWCHKQGGLVNTRTL
jgi:hypothetical protein